MKKVLLLFACLTFVSMQVFAQARTITGTVTSADDGTGLPGVSVVVKGTQLGIITDMNGSYTIEVPTESNTLIFQFMGMETQEVAILSDVVNVVMKSSDVAIDDVVVTALGVSREKKSLGYSVQEVDGDEVNAIKGNDFTTGLSGKVAGLQIKTNTNFGGSTNVILRGSSSLTGNNQALFVVDGIPIDNTILNSSYQQRGGAGYDYGNTASDVNPNDIESISVLKGAAATALYGSRAANGVILITTKKGAKSKALGVTYSGNVTVGVIDRSTFPKYQNKYGGGYGIDWYAGPGQPDHFGVEWYDWTGDGVEEFVVPTYEDASMGEPFDPNFNVYQWSSLIPGLSTYGQALPWVAAEHDPSYFFEKSVSLSNSIQVSGGGENATYRLSYQNLSQTGIMPNSKLDKNNFSFTGTYDMTDKVKVTSFANYIGTDTKGRNNTGYNENILSSFRQWYQVNVDILELKDAFDLLGTNATWNMNAPDDLRPAYWDNPYWHSYKNYQSDSRDRFIGYIKVDYDVAEFLSVTARAAIDNYSYIQEERKAVGSIPGAFGVGYNDAPSGYAVKKGDFNELNFDLMAHFRKNFSESINFKGLIGTNIRKRNYSSVRASTNGGLAVPEIYSLANTKSPLELPEDFAGKIQVNGYFADASFGIANMVFIDGAVRIDQSSTLPTDNNTYVYPSVSTSFIFSELLGSNNILSLGKLRINYAEVGNDAPFASLYDVYYQAFPFNGNGVAQGDVTKNNPELKSERTKSLEAGLTLNFMQNRVGFDIAFYNNRSVDQIMPAAISTATGYNSKFVNAGEISNKGVEVMLNFTPVKTSDFRLDVDLNWAKNKSEVVSLDEGLDNLQLASLQGGVTINARVGEPFGTIQGTDYVYYNDVRSPENRIIEDGIYWKTSTNDQVIGDINPDWTAGLRTSLSYRDFKFSFLIDWKKGGDIFSLDMWYGSSTGLYEESAGLNDLGNPVRNYADGSPTQGGLILQGVLPDGTVNNVRSDNMGTYYTPVGSYVAPNSMFIYDASYVKLREMALTYTIPAKLLNKTFIKGASVSLVGTNLWIIHKNLPYADPETTQGAGNIQGWQSGVMPSTRNFGFSLNINF